MNERFLQGESMPTATHRWAVVTLALCACAFGLAAESQKTRICGWVVDDSAQPVAGAEVAVYERFRDASTRHDVARPRGEIAATDRSGRFTLAAGPVAPYRVFLVARKDGYALAWDLLTQADDNFIVLAKTSVLAGIVVDGADRPVAGAQVRAVPKSSYLRRLEQEPILAPESWLTTRTDYQGHFRFDNLAADVNADFWVEARDWALVYQYTTHPLTACGFETGRTDIRLVLPQEVPCQGRVIEAASGKPVEGARILLHPQDTDSRLNLFLPESTTSGRDGRFAFPGVPPGRCYLNVLAPASSPLVDKRVAFDVAGGKPEDIIVGLETGGLIEIVAREGQSGEPLGGLGLYFWEAVQDERSSFYKDVVTDENGRVRLPAPAGECLFSARLEGYGPSSHRGSVLVTAGQVTRSEIRMDRDSCLTAIVLDVDGQPVCGAAVNPGSVLTDTAGRFEVRLALDDFGAKWIIRHGLRNLAAVADIEPDHKSARLTLKPALTVGGRITTPDGVGIAAARVALHLGTSGMLLSYGHEFLTDADGRYELPAVVPEQPGIEYRISVNAAGYGTRQFRRISIAGEPGARVSLDPVVLEPADQSVSGVVVDAQGRPAGGLAIFARGSNQPTRTTVTDSDGRFTVRRICRGPVRIQAGVSRVPEETGSLWAEGGDRQVKIVLGQDGVHLKYASLQGKPLPNGKDLVLDWSGPQVQGKRALICFFDWQQRPSRRAVMELARQAESLRQKGIVIAAVQVEKIDRAELGRWVKDNRLPFPVGMVRVNGQEVRRMWGLKSLPWLILTDGDHVVTAEGFDLEELGQRIGDVADRKK